MKEIKYWTAKLGRGTATMAARPTQCGLSHHREGISTHMFVMTVCLLFVSPTKKSLQSRSCA